MAKTLYIIGGGASGFFCAVNAARLYPDLRVVILEKSAKLLSKVKVSGGGRCNVTHACFDIAEMARRYPRGGNFVKKIFHEFFTSDTINWFEERGVQLKTEADGRMFPVSDSSQTIIDCLLNEAGRYGVTIRMQEAVTGIRKTAAGFEIETAKGTVFHSDYVCVACGGFPKAEQFEWLRNLGHTIAVPVPSLFTFNSPQHPLTELMGVSVTEARVAVAGTKLHQRGALLVTHWGISGPAVLRLSAWAARDLAGQEWTFTAIINWLPELSETELRERFVTWRSEKAAQKIGNKNPLELPGRLWLFLLTRSGIDEHRRWADLPSKNQNLLIRNLLAFELPVKGKTTYKEEFVTAGGITLAEVEPQTMMSRKIPGLFFTGEVIDVDGITGGYNFQNAWSTGFIAARSAGQLASAPSF
ncbi:NAD(P)/FAD-dependent oxidoreductase [Niabella beijingensis]|uniref:NAD(P)/FAD-dependent oxidoreductase n=1 Tax=Niabella beijingensis TaxID=2872700 RepID=UPI001CBFFBB4|nr:NAD(P)/FAD-dependent oxidoreductase [Niabella beijingensis]MBZ4191026.1 NAD(P)/FAD-dependent oxidoreductase [Niabella beijingensis]